MSKTACQRYKYKDYFVFCILTVIFIFALILRLNCNNIGALFRVGSDAMTYDNAAKSIIENGFLIYDRDGSMLNGSVPLEPTGVLAVGYPVFLSIIYKFFADSLQIVFRINVILSMITLYTIYLIIRELNVAPCISLLATACAGIYPAFIYMNSTVLTETIYVPLCTIGIYYCVKCANRTYQNCCSPNWISKELLLGYIALALASTIKAQGFLFFLLFFLVILIDSNKTGKQKIVNFGAAIAVLLIVYTPIWIWLKKMTGSFIFYPTAGDGPKVWGAQPYFFDMEWTFGKSLDEVISANRSAEPSVYARWRIFGFFYEMWYDLWDENIFHPFTVLHPFLSMQHILVVPVLASVPFFVYRYTRAELIVALVPLLVTVSCMGYHGLPRYVIAAVPMIFVLFAVNLNILLHPKSQTSRPAAAKLLLSGCLLVSACFSVVLVYSVYFFPNKIDTELSNYVIAKYMQEHVSSTYGKAPVLAYSLTSKDVGQSILVSNALNEGNGLLVPYEESTVILTVDVPVTEKNDKIITKASLDLGGGYFFDFTTVYWRTEETDFSERKVYKLPMNGFNINGENQIVCYFDGDISQLSIAPTLFWGDNLYINSITIEKYAIQSAPANQGRN